MQQGPQNPPGHPPQPGQPYPQQPGQQYPMPGAPYPGGPMPGMAPPYYQPPPEKGFPAWAIVLIVFVCLLPFCGVFGLAAIPLVTANTRDARRSEGEQMLGSMKNRVKVAFVKLNAVPPRLVGDIGAGGCGAHSAELEGKYFDVRDSIEGDAQRAVLRCDPGRQGNRSDGTGELTFSVAGPSQEYVVWK